MMFLGEIFQIQTQTINDWPYQTQPKPQKTDPTQKNLPDPITSIL